MDELQKQILAEKENVEIALENLRLAKSRMKKLLLNWQQSVLFFIVFTMD